MTTPCILHKTIYKSNDMLYLQLTEEEEILMKQLVSNYDKLSQCVSKMKLSQYVALTDGMNII